MTISILIPTLNAGDIFKNVLQGINSQVTPISKKIIIDSGSSDETVNLAKQSGFEILWIDKKDFDHGYARQILADAASDIDILIYLTQDCILYDKNSISNLLTSFNDEKVAIAYGRQLPHIGAKILESHSRLFNYPNYSKVKTLSDKKTMGIKTASCSNSFAAYREKVLKVVGGFPSHSIFGEDVIVGGKLILKGWKIAYVAEAMAYHSHNYSVVEEFKRFFDIGVFHSTNYWLIKEFGTADGEGFRYLRSELKEVFKKNILVLPKMVLSTIAKLAGYKLGLNYKSLPEVLTKNVSMHKSYWEKKKLLEPV